MKPCCRRRCHTLLGPSFSNASVDEVCISSCSIERGADANTSKALLLAVQCDSIYAIQKLLLHGGNPNGVFRKISLLTTAFKHGCELSFRILLAAGADPNSIDWRDCSELLKNTTLIELLLDCGAIINIPNDVVARPLRHTRSMAIPANRT